LLRPTRQRGCFFVRRASEEMINPRWRVGRSKEARNAATIRLEDVCFLTTIGKNREPSVQTISDRNGELEGHKIRATLRLRDASDFPLTNRGFHWINDRPFSRRANR